ncbi:hypothetical protein TrRE_jg6540 [Triparma retinervis]|uniref:Uncharacterized protein n=1 Tax=Triparma retinervis TaxID=2557542 RepID=A0A9W6ZDB4_9STRA|nr:hypothetical protein TrRE_jg6540 [Triparma retinervis]
MRSRLTAAVLLTLPAQFGATVANCGGCFCVPEEGESCPDFEPVDSFSPELIEEFNSKALLNPFGDLECNPYKDGNCETSPARELVDLEGAVCAFKYSVDPTMCSAYEMESYPSEEAALADGAFVSHLGACGLCSTAQDLAAYMANPDMTSAGKKCAAKGIINEHWGRKCYEDLGFTTPCATIWNYDGVYDGKECAWTCIKNLSADNNGPPPLCELNDCLQCDEDKAGPVFKDFAGRTRRRSGLPSAIARSCSEFPQIIHESCPEPAKEEEEEEEEEEREEGKIEEEKYWPGVSSSCWDQLSDCESWCSKACLEYVTPYGLIYCC